MCGLVGVINTGKFGMTHQDVRVFDQLLYADALRGFHSTGVMSINKYGSIEVMKSTNSVFNFLNTKQWESIKKDSIKNGNILIGHNRHATKGKINDETAHPFTAGDITLVHNGTLHSHKSIHDCEVDSEAICNGISKDGHHKTLEKLDGAFALIWYDFKNKRLYFSRNSKRPLHMAIGKTTGTIYIASEAPMLEWILDRNSIVYDKIVYFASENKDNKGTVYWLDLDDWELKKEMIPFRKETNLFYSRYYSSSISKDVDKNTTIPYFIDGRVAICTLDNYSAWSTNNYRIVFRAEDLKTTENGLLLTGTFKGQIPVECYSTANKELEDCFSLDGYAVADIYERPLFIGGRVSKIFCENARPYMNRLSSNKKFINAKSWITEVDKNGGVYCNDCNSEITTKDINKSYVNLNGNGDIVNIKCEDCCSYKGVAHAH